MALRRADGVVLRTRLFAESDLIVEVFYDEAGRRAAIAKGARRPGSRLGGTFDALNRVEVVFYEKPQLDLVSQGALLAPYSRLKSDLTAVTWALSIASVLVRMLPLHQPEPQAFHAFRGLLEALDATPDRADPLCLATLLRLLTVLGHRPRFDVCVRCGKDRPPYTFSEELGGVVCRACSGEQGELSAAAARSLDALQRLPLDRACVVKLRAEDAAAGRAVLERFADWLGRGG